VLAPTSEVTLAAGTKVVLATGSVVSLAAGAKVAVTGASAAGQTAPTFAGRTVSASSSVSRTGIGATWTSVIPAPASTSYIELHGALLMQQTTGATRTLAYLSSLGNTTSRFASFGVTTTGIVFTFQGATLPAGRGVWAKILNTFLIAQLNYAVRS
jgi:hypothetical protein